MCGPANILSSTKNKIFIIIPAYKADETLAEVFERIPNEFMEYVSKIIVVEDGSYSGETATSAALAKLNDKIQIEVHSKNLGYGAAQKTGLKIAFNENADIAIILHADGQYPPELLSFLVEPIIKNSADVVMGSRMHSIKSAYQGGMPVYKIVANKILTYFENFLFGMNISEFHSGYMIYSKKALSSIPFFKLSNTFHFDGEMLILAHLYGLKICDLPIPTHYGNEVSHLKPVKYGLDVLRIAFKIKYFQLTNQIRNYSNN